MSYLMIGERIPAHGDIPEHFRLGYNFEGMAFKDEDAFLNRPHDICYINELAVEDVEYGKPLTAEIGYSHWDLVNLCGGSEEMAKKLFYALDWQAPSTLIDENVHEEEWAFDELTGKLYDIYKATNEEEN